MFNSLKNIWRKSEMLYGNTWQIFVRSFMIKLLYRKNIYLYRNVRIVNIENISIPVHHFLNIGCEYIGFTNNSDQTFLNIQGKMILEGNYTIHKGCRFDIGKNAVLKIGEGGYINAFSKIIAANRIEIGDHCAISWDVQILDEDFHEIEYEGKKHRDKNIKIGNRVWIGSGASVYQGTRIADGCVVASDSVVRGIFEKENCIIAGNPAKIIKENISWK